MENNVNESKIAAYHIGSCQVFPLSEGSFSIDKTKQFIPFDHNIDDLQQRPTGSLLVEVQPFLVITPKDVLLLDTGLGFNDSSNHQMQLHHNLKKAGIEPSEVTKVLLTHLHKDHSGGVCLPSDRSVLSCPNATYYLQKKELDFAVEKGLPSFEVEDFDALRNASNVILLEKEEGVIDEYIHYKITGAHSPFHQVFTIADGSQKIFFGGDVAPQLQQMKVRYKTKYDYEPAKAMELRQQWWQQGKQEGWTFLFYHDVKQPFVTASN